MGTACSKSVKNIFKKELQIPKPGILRVLRSVVHSAPRSSFGGLLLTLLSLNPCPPPLLFLSFPRVRTMSQMRTMSLSGHRFLIFSCFTSRRDELWLCYELAFCSSISIRWTPVSSFSCWDTLNFSFHASNFIDLHKSILRRTLIQSSVCSHSLCVTLPIHACFRS